MTSVLHSYSYSTVYPMVCTLVKSVGYMYMYTSYCPRIASFSAFRLRTRATSKSPANKMSSPDGEEPPAPAVAPVAAVDEAAKSDEDAAATTPAEIEIERLSHVLEERCTREEDRRLPARAGRAHARDSV